MRSIVLFAFALLWPSLLTAADAPTAELTAAQRAFFEAKIRPVLVEHCYACHSDKAAKSG